MVVVAVVYKPELLPFLIFKPVVVSNCLEIGGGGVSIFGAFTGSGTTF
jgi:hypothetical protein